MQLTSGFIQEPARADKAVLLLHFPGPSGFPYWASKPCQGSNIHWFPVRMLATQGIMNRSVKRTANSTDTSRLGTSDLQEKATSCISRLKSAQIKQTGSPRQCTWQRCHQLPQEWISAHTLCSTIPQAHLHLTTGFTSLSHVRSDPTEVNAVSAISVHTRDIWV